MSLVVSALRTVKHSKSKVTNYHTHIKTNACLNIKKGYGILDFMLNIGNPVDPKVKKII